MPFLVDTITALLSDHDVHVHRLLHPLVIATRDPDGQLSAVGRPADESGARESMIYIEAHRDDARTPQALDTELRASRADVRAAANDWPRLKLQLLA